MGICDTTAIKVVHSNYMLANKGEEAPIRFAALAAIYDPQTIRHFETLGVACGWRCLEVGAGSGTIAKWLADRVGPTGCVLVTDVDIRFLELRGPTLDVRAHDIGSDPLPDAEFDLIHTASCADARARARCRSGAHGLQFESGRVANWSRNMIAAPFRRIRHSVQAKCFCRPMSQC